VFKCKVSLLADSRSKTSHVLLNIRNLSCDMEFIRKLKKIHRINRSTWRLRRNELASELKEYYTSWYSGKLSSISNREVLRNLNWKNLHHNSCWVENLLLNYLKSWSWISKTAEKNTNENFLVSRPSPPPFYVRRVFRLPFERRVN
jgi:hypothetical protein